MHTWSGLALAAVVGVLPPAARAQAPVPNAVADDATLIALAISLACTDAPEAEAPSALAPAPAEATGPELELVATVHAKTLQFQEIPKVGIALRGTGAPRTRWTTERVNLPEHPEPGVVYRDVAVRLTITGSMEELAELLAQAQRASQGIQLVPAQAAPEAGAQAPAQPAQPAPAARSATAAASTLPR